MRKPLLIALLFLSTASFSQFHFGVFAGGANYIGELNDKLFKGTYPALGVTLNYEVSDRVMLRSGFTYGKIQGNDQWSGNDIVIQNRNARFKSNIFEASLIGELTAFNLYNIRWSPYFFAGVALFNYYPYTDTAGNSKVPLRRLSTEGQGLGPEYPALYSTVDVAIPFGGGVKYNINEDVRLGLEVGLRKTFTDHLDDVGGAFPSEADLLSAKGPAAVQLSYRGPNAFPTKGTERGNVKTKDWYYFTGLHLTFRIGGGYGKTDASGYKKGYKCPTNL